MTWHDYFKLVRSKELPNIFEETKQSVFLNKDLVPIFLKYFITSTLSSEFIICKRINGIGLLFSCLVRRV